MGNPKAAVCDPVETIVRDALEARGVKYTVGHETHALDFDLPDLGCQIECKQFHTPRISDQLSRHADVIVIQGMGAARAFAKLLQP